MPQASMLLQVISHDTRSWRLKSHHSVLLAGIFQFSVAYTLLKPSPVDLEVQTLLKIDLRRITDIRWQAGEDP